MKPSVKLVRWMGDPRVVAAAGKLTLSSKSYVDIESGMDDMEVRKWILEMIRRGHTSPFEHLVYTFEVVCSRVTSHQIVRHRIASYTQHSQRYTDKWIRKAVLEALRKAGFTVSDKADKTEVFSMLVELDKRFKKDEAAAVVAVEELVKKLYILPVDIEERLFKADAYKFFKPIVWYYELLCRMKPEDARYVLPQGVTTKIVVTMNARELLEVFLPLRMCSRAQWEIRYIAWELWRQLRRVHPEVWDYAGPRCILAENRNRMEPVRIEDILSGAVDMTISRCPELVPREAIRKCIWRASGLDVGTE